MEEWRGGVRGKKGGGVRRVVEWWRKIEKGQGQETGRVEESKCLLAFILCGVGITSSLRQ